MNAVTYLDENYCNLILSTDNYIGESCGFNIFTN